MSTAFQDPRCRRLCLGWGWRKGAGWGRSLLSSNSKQQPRPHPVKKSAASGRPSRRALLAERQPRGSKGHREQRAPPCPGLWPRSAEHRGQDGLQRALALALLWPPQQKYCSPLPSQRTKGGGAAKRVGSCQLLSLVGLLGLPMVQYDVGRSRAPPFPSPYPAGFLLQEMAR